MPLLRHAFIQRALRELGRHTPLIARARESASLEAGLQCIREACVATLGMELDTLARFDSESVVGLFTHPEQARILAWLVDERARLYVRHGWLEAGLEDCVHAGHLLASSRKRFGVPRDLRAAESLRSEVGERQAVE